ncbi:MAG: hypothetical protein KDC24_13495 [Saprospiraceae bacterium]|nr:hypothetical protein [Saprospiraceae bacterium]
MSTNKILIAGLIGGIILLVAGFIFYGLALTGFYEANMGSATGVNRAEEDMVWWAMIVGHLAAGLLLAIIFGRWANISTLQTGFIAGMVIGLLMGVAYSFITFATTNVYNLTITIVDPIVMAVMHGLGGAGVAWYLGRN